MKKLLIILVLCLPTFAFGKGLEKKKALELIDSTVMIHSGGSQGTGVTLFSHVSKDKRVKKTYIITNKHVAGTVGASCKITKYVLLKQRNTVGKKEYDAKVVFVSKKHDISLLEVDTPVSEQFRTVEFSTEKDWDKTTLYSKIYLVSCGLGTIPTVTTGNLSYVNKDETKMGFTAHIIYGSSGGGLYNKKGQLVGLCNAIRLTRGHPITHKALGIPLPTILSELKKSKFKFIVEQEPEPEEDNPWDEEEEEEDWNDWEDNGREDPKPKMKKRYF
jgi:S1-C subfamily serine protease